MQNTNHFDLVGPDPIVKNVMLDRTDSATRKEPGQLTPTSGYLARSAIARLEGV